MKWTIKTKQLKKALELAKYACEGANTIPVLAYCLLKGDAETGRGSLTSTDLDVSIVIPLEWNSEQNLLGESQGKLSLCVQLERLLGFIKLASSETLELEQVDDELKVQAGKSKITLKTLPESQFPAVEIKIDRLFTLPRALLVM